MSQFRPNYNTTAQDRADRRKKREMQNEDGGSLNPNSGAVNIEVPRPPVEKGSTEGTTSGSTLQISDIDYNDFCDKCKQAPEPDTPVAICKICGDCFCGKCVGGLSPNTLAELNKSKNLMYFCDSCICTALHNLCKLQVQDAKPTVSVECLTSDVRTVTPAVSGSETSSNETKSPVVSKSASETISARKLKSSKKEEPTATQMKNLVEAIENLQVKMCNMEDMILSNGKKKNQDAPKKKQQVKKSFAQAATDSNAPPAIVVYQADRTESPAESTTESTTESTAPRIKEKPNNIPVIPLEGRDLVPRLMVPAEIIEERDLEKRKYNIIVQNLKESEEESPEDRKKHDIMEVRCMLAGMQLTDIDVKTAIRMGKKLGKPQSLLVTLDAERDQVLERAGLIHRYLCWKKVWIDPDHTPKQQDEHKELMKELKRRQESGENVYLRNGKFFSKRPSRINLNAFISEAEEAKQKEQAQQVDTEAPDQPAENGTTPTDEQSQTEANNEVNDKPDSGNNEDGENEAERSDH